MKANVEMEILRDGLRDHTREGGVALTHEEFYFPKPIREILRKAS